MDADKWQAARAAKTLIKAHEAIARMRPAPGTEDQTEWRRFYELSASVYRELAEVDRGHHHEALYWANREQKRANSLQDKASKNPRN